MWSAGKRWHCNLVDDSDLHSHVVGSKIVPQYSSLVNRFTTMSFNSKPQEDVSGEQACFSSRIYILHKFRSSI